MAIRIAVVGIGKIARDQHLPAIAGSGDFILAATVSRSGADVGVPGFADLVGLAASGVAVDAVALCGPPVGRHVLAAEALRHGWHVLLEKPPGATISELAVLPAQAAAAGRTLFATWHSRFAAGVAPAAAWLAGRQLRRVAVTWQEDIRRWHPGQDWLLAPGGLGVFDPGINALSILTAILPGPLAMREARLLVPADRQGPIAASVAMAAGAALVTLDLDFRITGDQIWSIVVETDSGTLRLDAGGERLAIDGAGQAVAAAAEYPALYARFAELIAAGASEFDVRPLQLVGDAFLIGSRQVVPAFTW
ncbi:hypothetical protein IP88_15260 [alpha proteobacterium AAP81b]|nr:hypothetical protein IP88_15260 [alpha proteobacterium AAP81b]